MPQKKQSEITTQLESPNPSVLKPRLIKLIVRNYRCIGRTPVEIDLDDIVILVGPNNAGKSSILKAYELAMFQGSKKANLEIDDFPDSKIDSSNLPEIEVHTVVYDETVGKQWINYSIGEKIVKEKWVWEGVGAPKRYGWDTLKNGGDWSEKVPWGAPNIANSRRPEPHRVDAFDSPDQQAESIQNLLTKILNKRVKNIGGDAIHGSKHKELLDHIKELQKGISDDAQGEINDVNSKLSEIVSKVFPGYKVDFDPKTEDVDKAVNFFQANPKLLMGPEEGYLSPVDQQGSGARRTLLWAALKLIADDSRFTDNTTGERPNLLLIDEPEICLHPNAIRGACKALYELSQAEGWQVMVTTHSPVFIDFSRDNTTIVRVEKDEQGEVRGTTVFRPEKIQLNDDDRDNLKLLNICDPYIAEFFFGGTAIIVEGDTEYTAFHYVIKKSPVRYSNVHIIRARGKATIKSLVKILNHFGAPYAILHDSDRPRTKNGSRANPAWKANQNILEEVYRSSEPGKVRLLASIPNFEEAYLDEASTINKPYSALKELMENSKSFAKIKSLLDSLINHSLTTPVNCKEWGKISDLESALNRFDKAKP